MLVEKPRNDQFLEEFKRFKSFQYGSDNLFEKYVSMNPVRASKYALSMSNNTQNEQFEFLSGIRLALYLDTLDLDWGSLLSLFDQIINTLNSGNTLEACALLEQGLADNFIDYKFKDQIWSLIQKTLITKSKQPTLSNRSSLASSLDYSTSQIDGMSFRLLFRYLNWCNNNDKSNDVFPKDIKKIIDNYQNNFNNYTIPRHAALGIFFPDLFFIDKQWSIDLFHNIYKNSNEPLQISLWSAYVWFRMTPDLFIPLRSIYDEFLNNKIVSDLHNTMLYSATIEHVTFGYLYSVDGFDKIFWRFITSADDESIDICLIKIHKYWTHKNTDKIMPNIYKLWQNKKIIKSKHVDSWFSMAPINELSIDCYLESLYIDKKMCYFELPTSTIEKYIDIYPLKITKCIQAFLENRIYKDTSGIDQLVLNLRKKNDPTINQICDEIENKINLKISSE